MASGLFVCPRCYGSLATSPEGYRCGGCSEIYPIIAGIPDFRLDPDPWLDLEADRAKATRLHEMTAHLTFEESVRAYWSITPDTPRRLSERFTEHVLRAAQRSAEWLDALGLRDGHGHGALLDLGCGTGDLLAAAVPRLMRVVGVDVALRWLVIARRRPELDGTRAVLVCANAQHLPFRAHTFSRVTALGLLEHCPDPLAVCQEAHRVLQPSGRMHARTVNRYALTPEPHVRLWGVGFLPRKLAPAYVRMLTGLPYQHHRPLSVRELRNVLRASGFREISTGAAAVLPSEVGHLHGLARLLVPWYTQCRQLPLVRSALGWIAPLLECSGGVA